MIGGLSLNSDLVVLGLIGTDFGRKTEEQCIRIGPAGAETRGHASVKHPVIGELIARGEKVCECIARGADRRIDERRWGAKENRNDETAVRLIVNLMVLALASTKLHVESTGEMHREIRK